MIIEESGLKFTFADEAQPVKYDGSSFYRNYVNQLPEAKGVDFISVQAERLVFTEIKIKNSKTQKPLIYQGFSPVQCPFFM